MEVLAFTHAAVVYGDSATTTQLRSPEHFIPKAPNAMLLGWLAFAAFVGAGELFPASAQAALCIQGDEGAAVEAIQGALADEGYYFYGIDGAFESQTYDSVVDFQSDYGLTADGRVGNETLSALGLSGEEGKIFGYGESCNFDGSGGGGGSPSSSDRTVSIATNSAPLLVRQDPTLDSTDIDAIAKGETVSYSEVASSNDGTWLYVPSYGGWISADYTTYAGGGGGGGVQAVEERGTIRIATQYDPLTVRSQPTTASDALDSIDKGNRVNYIKVASEAEGTWLYVPAYGGWISADYTTYFGGGGGGVSETVQTEEGTVRIATQTRPLIVRSQPTTESEALNVIPKDTQVSHSKVATGDGGKWLYVPFYGGWISATYTTYGKADTAAPAATVNRSTDSTTGNTTGSMMEQGNTDSSGTGTERSDASGSPSTTSDSNTEENGDRTTASPATAEDNGNTAAPASTIVEETNFELGQLAEIKINQSPVNASPDKSSNVLTSIEQGTYVAYTKRATLQNGEQWYFLPAYNGWIIGDALELVSIDFP